MQSIEGMLRNQAGIHSVKVALLAERGVVEYDPSVWDADKIVSVSALFLSSVMDPCRIRIPAVLEVKRAHPKVIPMFWLVSCLMWWIHAVFSYSPCTRESMPKVPP